MPIDRALLALQHGDTCFRESVEEGPACCCSRCGQPILDCAFRVWSHRLPGQEWRYHLPCLGLPLMQDVGSEDL